MPRVYNKHHKDAPPDAVYVGRPTKWGNPFKIGDTYNGVKLERGMAVEQFRDWLLYSDQGLKLQDDIRQHLRGKDLVCYCAPKPCHADILLEVANA